MAVNYANESDPRKAAANQRGLNQQTGDRLMQQQQDMMNRFGADSEQYRQWLDAYLVPMLQGQGGYSPEEARQIANSGDLSTLNQTPEQAQSKFLTPEEQQAIKGNANYGSNFHPDQMHQDQDVSAGKQRQAVNDLQSGLKAAIDPNALSQSNKFQQDSENQLGQNQGKQDATLNAVAENVRGGIDPTAVSPSSQFLADYYLTPEQQQNIVTGAGISAGAGYRASEGAVDRAARAAGASPMGVAAYRARSERDAAAAGGDAMTQARIAVSNAAASRQLTGEQLREGAGQFLTNTRTGTEMKLGDEALASASDYGRQSLAQRNIVEQQRLNAEQSKAGLQLTGAATGGQAQVANEASINSQGRQVGQFNATTGADIAAAEDTANSGRAAKIATNRQGTEADNQAIRYGQGVTQTNLASGQAKQVADTRLADKHLAIGAVGGEQAQQSQNQQNEAGRQVSTYGTMAGAGNAATGQVIGASQTPSKFDRIVGGIAGLAGAYGGLSGAVKAAGGAADGGIFTEPTSVVIGENGPEAVVPIGEYRATAKARPSIAMGKQPVARRRFYGEVA